MATLGDPVPIKPPLLGQGTNTWTGDVMQITGSATGLGGGGGNSITNIYPSTGGYTYINPIYQHPPLLPNLVTTGGSIQPFLDVLQNGRNKLSPAQLAQLVAAHQFVPMDDGHEYCLFCYALDLYRTRLDHEYVIHED